MTLFVYMLILGPPPNLILSLASSPILFCCLFPRVPLRHRSLNCSGTNCNHGMHMCMSSQNNDSNSISNKLRLWEAGLPGFRFSPTEQELVGYYLHRAAEGRNAEFSQLIVTVDLYKHDPWNLPELAPMGDTAWMFLVPRDRKYPNGSRPNRVTKSGYWKATGTDRQVLCWEGHWSSSSMSKCIGLKKTLVFYKGRAPNGVKTPWIMNEYRLNDWEYQNCQADVTLCKVHLKSLPRSWTLAETGRPPLAASSTGTSSMTLKPEEEPPASQQTLHATETNNADPFDGPASNAMLYGFDDFFELGEQRQEVCNDGRSRNTINDNVNHFNISNNDGNNSNNGPSSMDHILLASLMDEFNYHSK